MDSKYETVITKDKDEETFEEKAQSDNTQKSGSLIIKLTETFRPLLGYYYGFIYTLFSCMNSILIKMAPSYNSFNHAIMRYFIQMVIMSYFIKATDTSWIGPKASRKLLVIRGIVGTGAIIFGLVALLYLDVSDFETLINSSILITALLGRIFLKEKITISHIVSLVLTILGVLFILRPPFLFNLEQDLEHSIDRSFNMNHSVELLQPSKLLNASNKTDSTQLVQFINRSFISSVTGVTFVLLSAFFQSSLQVVTRKLALAKIHFSLISIYPVYIGLPFSIIVSIFYYFFNTKYQLVFIPHEIFYSFCGGLLSVIGLICLNKALKHEAAAKIVMLRTTGVLFSFMLQYFILDVNTDILGLIGAFLIIMGTVQIMIIKLNADSYESNIFCKLLAFKF